MTAEQFHTIQKNFIESTEKCWLVEKAYFSELRDGYPYHLQGQNLNWPEGHVMRRFFWGVPFIGSSFLMKTEG